MALRRHDDSCSEFLLSLVASWVRDRYRVLQGIKSEGRPLLRAARIDILFSLPWLG